MTVADVLKTANFGERVAEEEGDALESYFVETEDWRRLYGGDVDIIYGPKGSGKSALYSLLMKRSGELFDRNVIAVAAENPQGTPAFKALQKDAPTSREEYEALWKLYFLILLARVFDDYGFKGDNAHIIRNALREAGLLEQKVTLGRIFQQVFAFVRDSFRPKEIGADISTDPNSGVTTVSPKIVFHEPGREESTKGIQSADDLLRLASAALKENGGFHVWLVLDRLDVAFAENAEVERQALRALFHAYLDLNAYSNIRLKIFLRTDIWKDIVAGGFREASHVTKSLVIAWDRVSLLNLIIRRAIYNSSIRDYYGVDANSVLKSTELQEQFFFRVFPRQIDVGPNKPNALDWLLSRTRDGLFNAPRELIHMLNEMRSQQMHRLEVGSGTPDGENLFERATFKAVLPQVSRTRLVQTLYAEFPTFSARIELLKEQKATQSVQSLATIWDVSSAEAEAIANGLVEIGFFERRGTRTEPLYWVPFLYRDYLKLVQGAAD